MVLVNKAKTYLKVRGSETVLIRVIGETVALAQVIVMVILIVTNSM